MEVNESNQSIYCYKNSNVLINKLGIMDLNLLIATENVLVTFRLAQIIDNRTDFRRNLTIDHYTNIHKHLFQDLYDFAGELRKEFTNKRNDSIDEEGTRIYCNPDFIYTCLKEQLGKMKSEAVRIKNREELLNFITKNYFELYYIHPFRDGNSRTLREFLRQYVEIMSKQLFKFGKFELDYSNFEEIDNTELTRALVWNISGDLSKQEKSVDHLKQIFDKCLIEQKYNKTR